MRQFIRMIALAAFIATSLFWLTKGAHTGWTTRYVSTLHIDPATEIDYPVEEPKLLPGADFLGGSLVVVAVIFSVSFFFRPSRRRRSIEPAAIPQPSPSDPDKTPLEPESDETPSETDPGETPSEHEPKEHS
jgi:hypothetical protein